MSQSVSEISSCDVSKIIWGPNGGGGCCIPVGFLKLSQDHLSFFRLSVAPFYNGAMEISSYEILSTALILEWSAFLCDWSKGQTFYCTYEVTWMISALLSLSKAR